MALWLFRSMKNDGQNKPVVAPGKRTLGALPGDPTSDPPQGDIKLDAAGFVEPESGGLSTTVDDPMYLPAHRRPKRLDGTGPNDTIFKIDGTVLPHLKARRDHPNDADPILQHHYVVEPAERCLFDTYQRNLAATVTLWSAT